MNNQLYIIKKLPLYIDEGIVNKKTISRNRNNKGEITRISINDQINYIAYLDYKIGNAIRGNHYHLIKKEFLYLCKGKIKGFFKDINNDILYEELIEEGTLVQIYIQDVFTLLRLLTMDMRLNTHLIHLMKHVMTVILL